MKTKIVYVLVSQESDYYYEMLLLSHYSLRLYHSKDDAEVVLVMDTDTHERLVNKKAFILDDVTPIVVSVPEEHTVMQSSRYIKTRLRQIVKGDFLYLDSDTIICGSLADIDKIEAEMAMIADGNSTTGQVGSHSLDLCEKAGFSHMEGQPYYNGGVMYVKDTPLSFALFDTWHRYWCSSVIRGSSYDQPALCMANIDCDYLIQKIPDIYNWQISCGTIPEKQNALIIHYYFCRITRKMIPAHIRQYGIDDKIRKVVTATPLQLYSLLTMSDNRLCQYMVSDMLCIYNDYPNYYKMTARLSRAFLKPYLLLKKVKVSLCCTTDR